VEVDPFVRVWVPEPVSRRCVGGGVGVIGDENGGKTDMGDVGEDGGRIVGE